jgi:predicted N-acetyltransferase YhbS
MLIRRSTPDEAEEAGRVGEEAFATVRSVYHPAPAAIANLAAASRELDRLVAEVGGRIVGTVRFGAGDEGRLRVIGLGVIPAFRGQGVARALIEALAGEARTAECRALALYTVVETGNVAAFERLGFRLVSERPDAYSVGPNGEPRTEAYMERPL